VLSLSRTATRLSGATILDIHRGNLDSAREGISKVEETLDKIETLSGEFSEFRTSQSVVVAYQEYVEAMTLRKVNDTDTIPSISELKADYRSYMLGLLDAIGECRRMSLNSLRRGDVKKAERLLDLMQGIYDDLQTLEHTSIIPTFRVKMDAARRIIESTRGDVVTEVRRYSLEQAIDKLDKRLSSRSKN
jgi:translin